MTAIPLGFAELIAAALDDYRLTTPGAETTPAGAAERVVEYVADGGYTITVDDRTEAAE